MLRKTLFVFYYFFFLFHLYAQKKLKKTFPDSIAPVGIIKGLSDSALLDVVQRQTFRFFWHYAHPVSGLARERDNTVKANIIGIISTKRMTNLISAKEHLALKQALSAEPALEFCQQSLQLIVDGLDRDTALKRLVKIVDFLIKADCYHGIYPHFMNGATGKTIPFGRLDDGADIVETSYLFMGLLCAREYFNGDTPLEKYFQKSHSTNVGCCRLELA